MNIQGRLIKNSQNTVYAGSISGTDVVGRCARVLGSNGHIAYYKIWFNRAKSANHITIAHEFGHAFGLDDLYEQGDTSADYGKDDKFINNTDKLMFGKRNLRTATKPITHDSCKLLLS